MRSVAIILPARNEQDAIGDVVRGVIESGATAIVVDNGSADATADVARRAGAHVVLEPQAGYGAACRRGLRFAIENDFERIGFMDADGSDPPRELPRLVARLDACDGVLGVRPAWSEGVRAMPPAQRFGNWFAPLALRVVVGAHYTDMPSCKIFRREAITAIDPRDETYGFTIEIMVRAHALGLRIEEVPIAYLPRAAGESKVSGNLRASVRAGVRILRVVGRYAWETRQRQSSERVAGRTT